MLQQHGEGDIEMICLGDGKAVAEAVAKSSRVLVEEEGLTVRVLGLSSESPAVQAAIKHLAQAIYQDLFVSQ